MVSRFDNRPDPDALLNQLREDQTRSAKGQLRIYFGANAGVGKTFAMLSAAQREKKSGKDILIGIVETHGRAETAELVTGLDQLPLRATNYRGHTLHEFDLDAALVRKPAILIVDELAHSNAEGSRHAKRWQDVHELIAAGINVWTAMNVQHLESLNGTIGAITGIRVNETVPDTVIENADEIILIDVTPDELLKRLKAGKVYLPQQAERAAQNFFRKGNLIALRELALLRTAEHVEGDVRTYKIEQSILPVWDTDGAILAGIGPHENASQTVRTAARLAGQLHVRWHVAYVETPALQALDVTSRDRILAVIQLAEELGAGTAILTDRDIASALVGQAQNLNCATLVVGRPQANRWTWLWRGQTMTRRLAQLAPSLNILEVGASQSTRQLPLANQRLRSREFAQSWHETLPRYAIAAASSVAIAAIATPLLNFFDLANIVMLFLLGTVLVALKLGRGPAALAAVVNVMMFDFFFVAPRFSFAVSDVQYLLTFAVMLAVGLLTGQLTAGLRFQARVSESRERRAQSLFELSRDLSAALMTSQVIECGEHAVRRSFGGEVLLLPIDKHDQLILPSVSSASASNATSAFGAATSNETTSAAQIVPAGFDASVADWTFRNEQPAGLATATLSAQAWHYYPLRGSTRIRGVLAIRPEQARWLLIPEQVQQLDTLARQIAIALERVHYVDVAQKALVQMESERLRNTLLAGISHDVRTPLTALLGLTESLQRSVPPLGPDQAATASAMAQAVRQLSALVNNLLDMARLENGAIKLRRDWHSVQELVGSATRIAANAMGELKVQTDIPTDLPLVDFDAVLIERVLVNLLENAAKYGAAPIVITARVTAQILTISVGDHGPGLPVKPGGDTDQLFNKFTRGRNESTTPGVGLGLAICKAIVQAHGGQIIGTNAPDGGALFTISLPRSEPPQIDEHDD